MHLRNQGAASLASLNNLAPRDGRVRYFEPSVWWCSSTWCRNSWSWVSSSPLPLPHNSEETFPLCPRSGHLLLYSGLPWSRLFISIPQWKCKELRFSSSSSIQYTLCLVLVVLSQMNRSSSLTAPQEDRTPRLEWPPYSLPALVSYSRSGRWWWWLSRLVSLLLEITQSCSTSNSPKHTLSSHLSSTLKFLTSEMMLSTMATSVWYLYERSSNSIHLLLGNR